MICRNCELTQLIIVNGYYFCPTCKFYVGKVSTYVPPEATPILTTQQIATEEPIVGKKAFVKHYASKITMIFVLISVVFYFTQDLFYFDVFKGCYIFLVPSMHLEFSGSGVKKALEIIKISSPDNYKNICERVNIIDTNIACGGMEGGCFDPRNKRTISVTAPSRNITWVAEVIAHEACHAKQAYEGKPGDEGECHIVGLKVMQELTIY